jgi:hypothetical protein
MFDELLALHFSDVAYFTVHRLFVDTYALQHPERYCASAKSLAAHLTGLCWALEHGGNRAVGGEALRAWLDGTPRLQKPEIPSFRGSLTVADALPASGPAAHVQGVVLWARSTWEAYASLHATARGWIQKALEDPPAARRKGHARGPAR